MELDEYELLRSKIPYSAFLLLQSDKKLVSPDIMGLLMEPSSLDDLNQQVNRFQNYFGPV
jgi:hypothetical protein